MSTAAVPRYWEIKDTHKHNHTNCYENTCRTVVDIQFEAWILCDKTGRRFFCSEQCARSYAAWLFFHADEPMDTLLLLPPPEYNVMTYAEAKWQPILLTKGEKAQ